MEIYDILGLTPNPATARRLVITAAVPFGTRGATNLLRIALDRNHRQLASTAQR